MTDRDARGGRGVPDADGGLSRRAFGRAAVVAGGAAALSACLERLRPAGPVPAGDGAAAHPTGQHEWNAFLDTDDAGNHELPRHHVFLYCSLPGDGPPDARFYSSNYNSYTPNIDGSKSPLGYVRS